MVQKSKKITSLLLCTSLVASLAACGVLSTKPATLSVPATPSTATRPQLSDAQAANYTMAKVLEKVTDANGALISDPWDPTKDAWMNSPAGGKANYTVDKAAKADGVTVFNSVQAAVSKAVVDATASGSSARIYIEVKPGEYNELLYVPALAAPITVYSTHPDATKTRIAANIDAGMPGDEYVSKFAAQFANVDASIKAMYAVQAKRGKSSIGTSGSAMVWVKNNGFQVRNMTLDDTYNEDRGTCKGTKTAIGQCPSGNHQAVAFLIDAADKVHAENVRFISNQDTLYFKSAGVGKTVRSFYRNSYVEGDVDFIFGRATAYFTKTEIKSLGSRTDSVFATAPSTNLNTPYGIVMDDCDFTSDGQGVTAADKRGSYLVRQWFEGQRCSPYGTDAGCTINPDVADTKNDAKTISRSVLEAVGKTVILNSRIGNHINLIAPWANWESDPAKSSYRLVQYSSDTFLANLEKAGKNPAALGYSKKVPADIYLGEYKNTVK